MKIYTIAAISTLLMAPLSATIVEMNLTLNTNHDGGLDYNNVTKSGAGISNSFVIGFQISLTSIGGLPVNIGPLAAFCSEIQEPISANTSYSFVLKPLSELAAGQAGFSGTASLNIPMGGIGDLRAARLAYLFDQHYISDQLTAWTMSDTEPTLHAFQLAVWEATHDDDLLLTSGSFGVGAQSGGNTTRRNNAIAMSQGYLDAIAAASVTENYVSTKFDFYALTSDTGNGANGNAGFQDLVLAVLKTSPEAPILQEMAQIPEPSTVALLFGLSAAAVIGLKRRRAK